MSSIRAAERRCFLASKPQLLELSSPEGLNEQVGVGSSRSHTLELAPIGCASRRQERTWRVVAAPLSRASRRALAALDRRAVNTDFRLNRILCALDVDDAAASALAFAGLLSRSFEAPLDGLYAAAPVTTWSNRLERVRQLIAESNARHGLEELLSSLATVVDARPFVTHGVSGDVILAHALEHVSDLIVLGGVRRARASRMLRSVAARARCGVLTVPGASYAHQPRNILLPIVDAAGAAQATGWAAGFAKRFAARVRVVGVTPKSSGIWRAFAGAPVGESHLQAERRLKGAIQTALARLQHESIAVHAGPTHMADPASIAALVRAGGYDLVTLGLPMAHMGSSTESMLLDRLRRDAAAPVLSIRVEGASDDRLGLAPRRDARPSAKECCVSA